MKIKCPYCDEVVECRSMDNWEQFTKDGLWYRTATMLKCIRDHLFAVYSDWRLIKE